MKKDNLLVVDWDYFFPTNEYPKDEKLRPERGPWELWDWGHRETELFIEGIWPIRLAGFFSHGIETPASSGLELEFWDRFKFNRGTVYYADSNMWAGTGKFIGYENVWLYDAHHDSGYKINNTFDFMKQTTFSCEDWMLNHYFAGSKLHVRYPEWKTYAMDERIPEDLIIDRQIDDNKMSDIKFDRVFICRSGAWTPPWLDKEFMAFVNGCPMERTVNMDGMKPREFDLVAAIQMAKE